jgi:hypothetical protein
MMLNTDIYVQFGTIRAQKAQPGSVEETRVIKSLGSSDVDSLGWISHRKQFNVYVDPS